MTLTSSKEDKPDGPKSQIGAGRWTGRGRRLQSNVRWRSSKRRPRRGPGYPPTPRAVALSVLRYYEALAPQYDSKYSNPAMAYMRNVELRVLLDNLQAPPLLLLDLGCGTGYFSIALARRGYRVIGLDLAPTMLRITGVRARRFPGAAQRINLLCASAEKPPIRTSVLDGVLALFGVLNHVSNLTYTLRNLFASLRPGALLLSTLANRFSLPNLLSRVRRIGLRSLLSRPPSWIRLYTREAHRRIWTRLYTRNEAILSLKAAGFVLRRVGGLLFTFPPCYHYISSPKGQPLHRMFHSNNWRWKLRIHIEEHLRWLPPTSHLSAYLIILAHRIASHP